MHSLDDVDDDNNDDDDHDLDHHYYYSEFWVFRTNVFSHHPFSYNLDKRSYHIEYMFIPRKHTFEIAQI